MFKVLSSLILIIACSTSEKYYRGPLSKQRLVVRTEYPKQLTNRLCNNDQCDIIAYSLNDSEFRRQANEFSIVCNIAGKRWKICLDKPGYCRTTMKCIKSFLWKCQKWEKLYIPASNHEYLLNAQTICQTYL